jgi:NADP-dependent 3-hydroxy acid dehydrogenase YdfG
VSTAVVTGASSGIGRATAQRLAADGFDVVIAARREDRLGDLAPEIGGRAVRLDVTDDASVAALAEGLDRCDVLVNVAGGAFGMDPVESGAIADWQRMFDVNVLGTLRVTQALLPLLVADGGGTIVNVTSTAASINYEGGGGYSAAKHAEHALTETLRLELSGRPVRVVEIAPGMVRTDEFSTNRFGGDAEAAAAIYAGVDRPLTAEDIAACIALTVELPRHVNIDLLVVRPVAQAAQHKVFRGKLFDDDTA